MDAILKRRSIRKYTDEPVPDETITELLRAAMSAPSARDQQPWQFVVIRDKEVLARVPEAHPYSQMVPHAQAAILVCGDTALEKSEGYWVQDCAAATENLLIAASAMGLGAVWLGVYPRLERVDGLRKLLGLPEHVIPLALVPIGHPAEDPGPKDRFREDRIHRDKW